VVYRIYFHSRSLPYGLLILNVRLLRSDTSLVIDGMKVAHTLFKIFDVCWKSQKLSHKLFNSYLLTGR